MNIKDKYCKIGGNSKRPMDSQIQPRDTITAHEDSTVQKPKDLTAMPKSPAFQITKSLVADSKPKLSKEAKIAKAAVAELYDVVDDYMSSKPPWEIPPALAIAAYDITTGEIVVDCSGPVPWAHRTLMGKVAKIGRIGRPGPETKNIIGACAEFRAANTLLNNGSKFSNIRFTKPIRPRTRQIQSTCPNCASIFSDIL